MWRSILCHYLLYLFGRVAVGKYYKLSGLNNRNLLSLEWFWRLEFQDQRSDRFFVCVFLFSPLSPLSLTAFLLCFHIVCLLGICTPGVSVSPDFFLYVPIRLDWSTHLVALFQLNHLFKGPVST